MSAPEAKVAVSSAAGVRTIRIDRADKLCAVDIATVCGLIDALVTAQDDPDVGCVVLTGTGRAFSAGADLRELAEPSIVPRASALLADSSGPGGQAPGTGQEAVMLDVLNRFVLAITEVPVPVVAAVNGLTVGVANSFVLASDLVLASSQASTSFGFSKIGLMPDGGATALVPARLGRGAAGRLLYGQETFDANEAFRVGWADEVIDAGSFEAVVAERTASLTARSKHAWAKAKQSLAAGMRPDLLRAMRDEAAGQVELVRTAEHKHAVEAF